MSVQFFDVEVDSHSDFVLKYNDHEKAEKLIIETSQFITPRKQKDLLQQAANCIDSNYFSCDFK